jgi:hypothetical protein
VIADAPGLEDVGAVGQRERDVRELLDEQHPDAGLRHVGQGRHQALDHDGREAQRELVDQQRRRARDQRLREDHHLLLAARQRARVDVPALLELGEQLERVLDARARLVARERIGRDA